MFEGGYRVPCVMRWPAKIPAGTSCDELCSTMDLLPTVAAMIGADPPDRAIDGRDVTPLLTAADAQSPHEAFYCYYNRELHAVRDRRWKLHLPHGYRTLNGRPGGAGGKGVEYDRAKIGLALFDLKNDVGETRDIAADRPDVVERLLAHAETARAALGDKLTGRKGGEVRPAARPTTPAGSRQ